MIPARRRAGTGDAGTTPARLSLRVNDTVVTLLGVGVVQGQTEDGKVLVRIKITDENRKHLGDANCWSPRAVVSGMWVFEADELQPAEQKSVRR